MYELQGPEVALRIGHLESRAIQFGIWQDVPEGAVEPYCCPQRFTNLQEENKLALEKATDWGLQHSSHIIEKSHETKIHVQLLMAVE
jgi:hypothetical protein